MTKHRVRVRNAADVEQVAKAARADVIDRDKELADLHAIADTHGGRRFLWRLLGFCGVFASTFDPDPGQMAFRSGQQDVGHFLLREIGDAHEEAWLMMQIEAKDADANRSDPEPTNPDA